MISNTTTVDFATLWTNHTSLLKCLDTATSQSSKSSKQIILSQYTTDYLAMLGTITLPVEEVEQRATDWLIYFFNTLFIEQNVQLVHGDGEPEYFPAISNRSARVEFAHGFFASALHEISHWCIAGSERRKLSDFGYWYSADGRSEAEQRAFERVEIKPQSLECLFTLACKREFQVSQDNLFATFDTSNSTFANDVYEQVQHYITQPHTLPKDAQILLITLLKVHNTFD